PPFLLRFQTDALRRPALAAVARQPRQFRRPFFAFDLSQAPFFLAVERAKFDANVALRTWEKSRSGAHASHPRLFSRRHSRSPARSPPCPAWPRRSHRHTPP